MKLRFWSNTSLPMYGSTVSELHLDIDGEHWLVSDTEDGPVLIFVDDDYVATQLPEDAEVLDGSELDDDGFREQLEASP